MAVKFGEIKLRVGKYWIKATLTPKDGRIFVGFPFNRALLNEVKSMKGAKWHGFDKPPRKIWSISNCPRNLFRLEFLQGGNPYVVYDGDILPYTSSRSLYKHQLDMVAFVLTRRYCIIAGEMGTGKTLAAIEAMEHLKLNEGLRDSEAWYVGPKSGVRAVSREIVKWKSQVKPMMYTYEAFTKIMTMKRATPRVVIFDESSKIKTPSAKRSQAALYLSEQIRETHGQRGMVILMSGTPAPKSPADWWHQAEVACPGFLREGHINKLKARLSLIEERLSLAGGTYPHLVTWLDDPSKCAKCGELREHANHDENATIFGGDKEKVHTYTPSTNEVQKLYGRMKGLVDIHFKKDCVDLPEKQYRVIKVMPTQETLRAAKLIKANSTRAVSALILLRELSDGFQYCQEVIGQEECEECSGTGVLEEAAPTGPLDVTSAQDYSQYNKQEIECYVCGGSGEVPKYRRSTDNYSSPKDDVFLELLEEHEEIGRFVVWGGFTGTIDRLVAMCHQQGWTTLRYDKTVQGQLATGEYVDANTLLDAMDNSHPKYKELLSEHPRVCFVGHPDAGGTALTLHASPTAFYYSNSFNGESRIQSEDRIHRLGMDANKGCTIIDLIHLQTDLLVLDNLRKKKKLQNLTLNALDDSFTSSDVDIERYGEQNE